MEIIASVETPLKDEQTELTPTHIRQTQRWWGGQRYISIHLRFLSSISFRYDAPIGWIVFGVLALLAAFVLGMFASGPRSGAADILSFAAIGAFIMFPVSLVIYFLGRKQVLVLASTSEEITVAVTAASKELLRDFAEKVEQQQIKMLKNTAEETKPIIPIKSLGERPLASLDETDVQFVQG